MVWHNLGLNPGLPDHWQTLPNSVKLQVILKSNVLFPPYSQRQCDCFLKKKLSYLQIFVQMQCLLHQLHKWINQHILSNIRTISSSYTAMPSNQNSSSAIARHLLDNLVCAAMYKPMMSTIFMNSNNEFQLSILVALLITMHKPE